jgi:uncharacterized cupredoxin-like copper-binding protein
VLLYALSTGHKVGLAVVGASFILFALASSFLFPRFRPNYPERALPAFIIVAFVFFFAMLTAVEVFGAEPKESEPAAQTEAQAPTTATAPSTQPTSTAATTTASTTGTTTTAKASAKPQTIQVTEKEFKITLTPATLHAGTVTFQIKNTGALSHDLAIVGGPKSKLISPGGTATFKATLKAGPIELYCSVPGHKQAGMDVKTTVSAGAAAAPTTGTTTTTTAKASAKPQTIQVTEKEFKITLTPATLHAGPVTFQIKNTGALPHDLAIVGGPKSKLISPGGTATFKATLKAGPIELYCTVPGHKQAGMDVKETVS